MTGLLRFIGIANAAFWFGASLFFTLSIGPAFFSSDMMGLFGAPHAEATARYYAGSAAQIVLERFFLMQECCSAIALVYLVVDWFSTGRPFHRLTVLLSLSLLFLSLVEGHLIQPKLHALHKTKYGIGAPVTQIMSQQAGKSFRIWHGVSQIINLIQLGGIAVFLWRVTLPDASSRFVGRPGFKRD